MKEMSTLKNQKMHQIINRFGITVKDLALVTPCCGIEKILRDGFLIDEETVTFKKLHLVDFKNQYRPSRKVDFEAETNKLFMFDYLYPSKTFDPNLFVIDKKLIMEALSLFWSTFEGLRNLNLKKKFVFHLSVDENDSDDDYVMPSCVFRFYSFNSEEPYFDLNNIMEKKQSSFALMAVILTNSNNISKEEFLSSLLS